MASNTDGFHTTHTRAVWALAGGSPHRYRVVMSDAAKPVEPVPAAPATLAQKLGIEGAVDLVELDKMPTALVPPASFAAAAAALAQLSYIRFLDLRVVDHVESGRTDRFEVYLVAYSMQEKGWARLKAFTEGSLPSVTSTYHAANAYEREAFDLFGVTFTNHPNLTRILLPDGWQGHPLRRDYDMPTEPVDFTVTRDLYNT